MYLLLVPIHRSSIALQVLCLFIARDKKWSAGPKYNYMYSSSSSSFLSQAEKIPVSATASSSNIAADTTWEFKNGLEGWAKATNTEMNAEVYHMGDEMRIEILASSSTSLVEDYNRSNSGSHLDSPVMNVPIGERQTLALRYRFDGPSTLGKIRLRGSFDIPNVIDHRFVNWGNDNGEDGKGFLDVYFPVVGDGLWHIGYAEINNDHNDIVSKLNNTITQIRLWPGCYVHESSIPPKKGDSFHIDWIRLVRAPVIERVTGCAGEKYFYNEELNDPEYNIQTQNSIINNVLHQFRTVWIRRQTNHSYALTYNCIWRGNEEITIEGINFGLGGVNGLGAPAHVYIDGEPCTFVKHDPNFPQEKLTCQTPRLRHDLQNNQIYHSSLIEVRNGKLTGLSDISTSLQYAQSPPKPSNIFLSRFASRSIDISWQPGGSIWDQMTCTGFIIKWREEGDKSDSWRGSMVTGNITVTTIRGLSPDTTYVFGISGLNEDQNNEVWFNLDLYGRRKILEDALEGPVATIIGKTLNVDIKFENFNANSTQNHGPKIESTSSIGPTGIQSGEGHYGLMLVGHANVGNCNASSFCCDYFDESLGVCKDETSYVCMGTTFSDMMGGDNNDQFTGSNYNNDDDILLPGNGKIVLRHNDTSIASYYQDLFSSSCGPSLRLTASQSQQVGAAWYPRQVEVGEGFETNFTFRISNPSLRCNNMDGIYTHCRSRGGDGLAFVIQGEGLNALGEGGKGMGYSGINNSLAVEFDTYFNHDENDPYENHISIQTRGWRHPNSENHVYSLGHTNAIPDLTDRTIRIRIKYEPFFDLSHISKPSFVTFPHMSYFFENGHGDTTGGTTHTGTTAIGDWAYAGLGLLHIYCQNMDDAVLIVPLHLERTLKLNRGRAWVGFTASTGEETFQVHDVLNFTFSSLRL